MAVAILLLHFAQSLLPTYALKGGIAAALGTPSSTSICCGQSPSFWQVSAFCLGDLPKHSIEVCRQTGRSAENHSIRALYYK